MIMFALISFMEDSGYMARMAYMMDRIFRFLAFMELLWCLYVISGGIVGGCAIPGAMATRTLRSPKEKPATLLHCPYMTCGAKLPIFYSAGRRFFPRNTRRQWNVLHYVGGMVFAFVIAKFLRSTFIKGESTPFVMELPPYRLPTLFSVLLHCWERAWMYIKKAGHSSACNFRYHLGLHDFSLLPEEISARMNNKSPDSKTNWNKFRKKFSKITKASGTNSWCPWWAGRNRACLFPLLEDPRQMGWACN